MSNDYHFVYELYVQFIKGPMKSYFSFLIFGIYNMHINKISPLEIQY